LVQQHRNYTNELPQHKQDAPPKQVFWVFVSKLNLNEDSKKGSMHQRVDLPAFERSWLEYCNCSI